MSRPATPVDDAVPTGDAVSEVATPPAVAPADQLALLRLTRCAVARQLGAPSSASIPRMSPSLLQRTEAVFVTLWVDGAMRGCRGADGRVLCQNTLEAARLTLQDDRVAPLRPDELDRLRIEVDVLGAPARVPASTPEEAQAVIEPGIHGVLAEKNGRRAIFRSSVAITRNWRVEELMRRLCEKGGWAPEAYRDGEVDLSRFRSIAFIESAHGGGVHELVRGHRPIVATDWSRDRVTRAIRDGADYLVRAQRPDGGFAYEYDPARGTSSSSDHVVRQLATMWLVAQLSRRGDTTRCRDVLARALPYIRARLQRLPAGDVLVVSDKVDGAPLGGAAFALLTLVAAEDDALRDEARDLGDAILSLQRPDGGFHTEFPGATRDELEDFYPGEAMLALMQLHARYPDPRYPESLRRALPYYRAHFRRKPSSAFVAWQMAAYAHLFRVTGEREYADFVFELADAIVPHQYVGAAVPYPDYVGGYRGGTGPGIPSATYNEGVLDALDVAKRTGDRERIARYQRAGLLAALFTLRLQLTEDSAYYVANPERALGAFRASLVDGALRIDHTQHALNSFLKAERLLFGNAAGARPRSEVVPAPSPS